MHFRKIMNDLFCPISVLFIPRYSTPLFPFQCFFVFGFCMLLCMIHFQHASEKARGLRGVDWSCLCSCFFVRFIDLVVGRSKVSPLDGVGSLARDSQMSRLCGGSVPCASINQVFTTCQDVEEGGERVLWPCNSVDVWDFCDRQAKRKQGGKEFLELRQYG